MDALLVKAHQRVSKKILSLENNPRPRGSHKLRAGGGYRIRVGDYRVLYDVDDSAKKVTIYAVGHRRDVYRAK
jgi:mRNA interferase RelE/StbE